VPTMDFEVYLQTNVPPEERAAALADLLRAEDAAGIQYPVIMPSPTPRPDNHALYETAGQEPRAILCCQVNPNNDDAFEEIERSVREWGMKMLKIMPAIYNIHMTGALASRLMSLARDLGILVNIHSGSEISHPLAIGALCRRFPDVPVVMDHMGYREWSADAVEAARDNPNLYLGTTVASFEGPVIKRAVQQLGAERVIYGSNWPLLESDLAVESIRRQKLGAQAEELIFGGNLARLLGME
jgi:uncharacterized protein